MTFEPTPTMIEGVLDFAVPGLNQKGKRSYAHVSKKWIQALITHLQNNPDDARVFAEGFMTVGAYSWGERDDEVLSYADDDLSESASKSPSAVPLYRLPEVQS